MKHRAKRREATKREREKMPEEDAEGSQNNKGKRFCSKEDKIGTLLAMFIVFNSLLISIVPMHI